MTQFHTHTDEHGALVKCYHSARSLLTDYAFWVGVTLSFPIEHFIWEHVPPFNLLAGWLGL